MKSPDLEGGASAFWQVCAEERRRALTTSSGVSGGLVAYPGMRAGGTKAALNSVISVPALRKAMVGDASPGAVARLSPAVNSQLVTRQPHAWQPEFVLGQ